MSDVVGNPEDRFSFGTAQLPCSQFIVVFQAISESVTQQDDDSILKCLIELAENVPKFLRPQAENVIAFCIKVSS